MEQLEVQFPGHQAAIETCLIIGRNPSPDLGSPADLLSLGDGDRSISKTHLALHSDATGSWVEDLHSTNGTFVVGEGLPVRLAPGVRTAISHGSVILFGDQRAEIRVAKGRPPILNDAAASATRPHPVLPPLPQPGPVPPVTSGPAMPSLPFQAPGPPTTSASVPSAPRTPAQAQTLGVGLGGAGAIGMVAFVLLATLVVGRSSSLPFPIHDIAAPWSLRVLGSLFSPDRLRYASLFSKLLYPLYAIAILMVAASTTAAGVLVMRDRRRLMQRNCLVSASAALAGSLLIAALVAVSNGGLGSVSYLLSIPLGSLPGLVFVALVGTGHIISRTERSTRTFGPAPTFGPGSSDGMTGRQAPHGSATDRSSPPTTEPSGIGRGATAMSVTGSAVNGMWQLIKYAIGIFVIAVFLGGFFYSQSETFKVECLARKLTGESIGFPKSLICDLRFDLTSEAGD